MAISNGRAWEKADQYTAATARNQRRWGLEGSFAMVCCHCVVSSGARSVAKCAAGSAADDWGIVGRINILTAKNRQSSARNIFTREKRMARGVNKVILIGNCGNDPETRYMPNGGAVTNLNIATSESWKDKQTGQQQERTEWHRCVFYQRLAEIAGEYLKKGSKVYVEGSLRTRKWQQDGQDRYTTEIIVSEMQMLDGRGEGAQTGGGDQPQRAPRQFGSAPSGGGSQGGGNNSGGNNPASNNSAGSGAPQSAPSAPPAFDNFDDDIPF